MNIIYTPANTRETLKWIYLLTEDPALRAYMAGRASRVESFADLREEWETLQEDRNVTSISIETFQKLFGKRGPQARFAPGDEVYTLDSYSVLRTAVTAVSVDWEVGDDRPTIGYKLRYGGNKITRDESLVFASKDELIVSLESAYLNGSQCSVEDLGDVEALAREIATRAFEGVTRRGGAPAITHMEDGIRYLPEEADAEDRAVMWLHDIKEDCGVLDADLLMLGVPCRVVRQVDLMTKKPGQSYDDYIIRMLKERDVCVKKVADITANVRGTPTPEALEKYLSALYRFREEFGTSVVKSDIFDEVSARVANNR